MADRMYADPAPAAVRAALKPDGRFAFETRNPSVRAREQWTPERTLEVADGQGHTVRVGLQVETPFDGRTVCGAQIYGCATWDAPRVSRRVLRFLDAAGVARFLSAAGFAIEEQFGDYARRPLTAESAEIVTVARAR